MPRYDVCLAWNWEYDADFVRLLEAACTGRGLSLLQVTPANLEATVAGLESGETGFRAFIDRASEADERFLAVEAWAFSHNALRINPRECSLWAEDKATMHKELAARGVDTPYTIILPSFAEKPDLPAPDLSPLGGSFAIKPARGGGGEGVVLAAASFEQVQAARRQYPNEEYLLQAFVTPQTLGARPAWFRVLFCSGTVHDCWWDPRSHVYAPVSPEERKTYQLERLDEVTRRIAGICELIIFSTEIAYSPDGRFRVVDYVNDQIDLRLQSHAVDGVPDSIVEAIVQDLTALAARRRR